MSLDGSLNQAAKKTSDLLPMLYDRDAENDDDDDNLYEDSNYSSSSSVYPGSTLKVTLNLAPDVDVDDLDRQEATAHHHHHHHHHALSRLPIQLKPKQTHVEILYDNDNAESGETMKKKYAKEAWPGRHSHTSTSSTSVKPATDNSEFI
jgi:hypothetical protein